MWARMRERIAICHCLFTSAAPKVKWMLYYFTDTPCWCMLFWKCYFSKGLPTNSVKLGKIKVKTWSVYVKFYHFITYTISLQQDSKCQHLILLCHREHRFTTRKLYYKLRFQKCILTLNPRDKLSRIWDDVWHFST